MAPQNDGSPLSCQRVTIPQPGCCTYSHHLLLSKTSLCAHHQVDAEQRWAELERDALLQVHVLAQLPAPPASGTEIAEIAEAAEIAPELSSHSSGLGGFGAAEPPTPLGGIEARILALRREATKAAEATEPESNWAGIATLAGLAATALSPVSTLAGGAGGAGAELRSSWLHRCMDGGLSSYDAPSAWAAVHSLLGETDGVVQSLVVPRAERAHSLACVTLQPPPPPDGGASCCSAASSWGELHHPARRSLLPCATAMAGGGAAAVGAISRHASISTSISASISASISPPDELPQEAASMQRELRALDAALVRQVCVRSMDAYARHAYARHAHNLARHMHICMHMHARMPTPHAPWADHRLGYTSHT